MVGYWVMNVILYLFKFVSSHYHYPTCGMMLIQGMISDEMRVMKELHSHIGVNIIYQQLQAHVLYQYGSILYHMWLFGYRSILLAVSRPRRQ
jgi:hypothetical protein